MLCRALPAFGLVIVSAALSCLNEGRFARGRSMYASMMFKSQSFIRLLLADRGCSAVVVCCGQASVAPIESHGVTGVSHAAVTGDRLLFGFLILFAVLDRFSEGLRLFVQFYCCCVGARLPLISM